MTTKEQKRLAISKAFLQFGVPGFFWWLFIFYCVADGMSPRYHGALSELLLPISSLKAMVMALGGMLFLAVIVALVFIYVIMLALTVYGAILVGSIIIMTPVEYFSGRGLYADNWMLFGAAIILVWTVVSALKLKLGEFRGYAHAASDRHDEAATDWDDSAKAEEIKKHFDVRGLLRNYLLLLPRMIVLVVAGPILFVVLCFMISQIKWTEEWDTREMK